MCTQSISLSLYTVVHIELQTVAYYTMLVVRRYYCVVTAAVSASHACPVLQCYTTMLFVHACIINAQ
jgi:hypothetical protein